MRAGPPTHPSFRWLVAARTTAILGNAIAPLALAFAVVDLTGSPTDLDLVMAARSIANVAVLLVIFSVINGALAAMSLPASSALVSQTVPSEQLRPANAILRLSVNAGSIVGASLGSVLVAIFGPGYGLALDAGTFLLAAVLFACLRLHPRPDAPNASSGDQRASVFYDLLTGWREFTRRRWVWIVVLQFMLVNAAFTGMTAVPVMLLAVVPQVPVLIAAFFLGGMAVEQFGIAWDQSLQQNIPADRLSRVYSYDAAGFFIAIPVGQICVEPLAGNFGTTPVLVGCAIIILISSLAAAASSVRRLTSDPNTTPTPGTRTLVPSHSATPPPEHARRSSDAV